MGKATGGSAGQVLARGARNLRLAAGCITVLLLVILLAGSLATVIVSRRGVTAPPERVEVRGDADYSRRRFFYGIEPGVLGTEEKVLLIEYFPVRQENGDYRIVGRLLEALDDPGDRTAHDDPSHARAPEVEKDGRFEGIEEPVPVPVLEDFRKTPARKITKVA